MKVSCERRSEYITSENEWADGWAIIAHAAKFASRFNSMVPGAYRYVSPDDIRLMVHCGLIGRRGFFERADVETIRGILRYEQLREDSKFNSNNGLIDDGKHSSPSSL
jgi:hypothetical protein